jgi:hypothetical protein
MSERVADEADNVEALFPENWTAYKPLQLKSCLPPDYLALLNRHADASVQHVMIGVPNPRLASPIR